jgi:hypothetical protein
VLLRRGAPALARTHRGSQRPSHPPGMTTSSSAAPSMRGNCISQPRRADHALARA